MEEEKKELKFDNQKLIWNSGLIDYWKKESDEWKKKYFQKEMELWGERERSAFLLESVAKKDSYCKSLESRLSVAVDNSSLRDNVISAQDSYLCNLSKSYLETRHLLCCKEAENRRLRLDEGGVLVRQLRDALLCAKCRYYVNTTSLTALECKTCLHCPGVNELLFEVQQFLFQDSIF